MESGLENQAPVLIIRKSGGHEGHHGGAWKVAYADFVTAMMAFFLVLWLVGQSEKVKSAVGGYFRDPVGFSEKVGTGMMEGSQSPITPPKPSAQSEAQRRRDEERTRDELNRTGKELVDALLALPGLSDIGDQIEVELTEEGLRIQLMESGDSTFFDLGSSTLSPRGMEVLSTVGRMLGTQRHEIVIEGHTDSRQYAGKRGYTNWELSSDRANTARRVLETNGIDPSRIKLVRAYADHALRYPDHPEDPRNRRVAIVVLNEFSLKRYIDLSERAQLAGRDTL
ncbi:MAG: flagellar motor protein MotB [Candidatus Zixiibacteriota bacterium]